MYERAKPTMFMSEIKRKNEMRGYCLVIYKNKVYNVHEFLPFHPGGPAVIETCKGSDATKMIEDIYNHPDVKKVLRKLERYHCGMFKDNPVKKTRAKAKKNVSGYVQSKDAVMCTWKD